MNKQIFYLNIPKTSTPTREKSSVPPIVIGRRYNILGRQPTTDPQVICAGYDNSILHGKILRAHHCLDDTDCFIWDASSAAGLSGLSVALPNNGHVMLSSVDILNNYFTLSNANLSSPELYTSPNGDRLSITANLEFIYTAKNMPAQLGVLSLVTPACFAITKDGNKHAILSSDNELPLLHLHACNGTKTTTANAITSILDTDRSDTDIHGNHKETVTHTIHEYINGAEVEMITIMEQYTTFFMHRELPFSQDNIWTPVYPPISWGWSIRVSRRHDGEWCISRKKSLMPSTSHNGLEMPEWDDNTLNQTMQL